MSIDTNIIFSNGSIFESNTLKLHFAGDFVQVINTESNTGQLYKSSDIRTITEIFSKKSISKKSGRQVRISISGQIIETSGSISLSGASFISIKDGSTTTWIPHQMFEEIEVYDHTTSEETAKLTKLLPITLAKGSDNASIKRGDSFRVKTSNRFIKVAAGWITPEGNFLFIRDYKMNTEYWIPSRLVFDIDLKG